MTTVQDRSQLSELLERVEGATADQQWALVRDAARLLLDIDDMARARINQLCDAGGFTDAAVALVARVLSGWTWCLGYDENGAGKFYDAIIYSPDAKIDSGEQTAKAPALALLAAMLKALLSHPSTEAQDARAAISHATSQKGKEDE